MLNTGLISYWKLDGNSNDSVTTNSGTDSNITYSAANGKIIQGASFNGTTSQIVFPDSASLRVTTQFTINLWLNCGLPAAFGGLFWDSAQLTTTSGILVGIQTSGKILFRSSTNTAPDTQGSQWQQISGTTNVADSTWRMITCVWEGSNLVIYVNAVSDGSIAWTSAAAYQATNYPRLGADNLTGGTSVDWYNGKMDEVGFWSRALSLNEIQTLYNAGNGISWPMGNNLGLTGAGT